MVAGYREVIVKLKGELDPSLRDSFARVGRLAQQTADGELVVGERRLAAYRHLGRERIPANTATNLTELGSLLRAEADENTCRLDLNPLECLEIGQAIEKAYKPKAEAAQQRSPERPKKGTGISRKLKRSRQETEATTTTAVAAAAVGKDRRTYEKMKAVAASKNHQAIDLMAKTRKVNRAYQLIRAEEKKRSRETKAREVAAALPKGDMQGVLVGDFREIVTSLPDDSVDLIFTDPPYDRKSLPLYEDLAKQASRLLCDGGSLIPS